MSRKGSLSLKTFFPNTGDQLVNEEDGVLWECVRSNAFTEEGEEKEDIRYALLRGVSGDERIYSAITDQGEKWWLSNICTIFRKGKGEDLKRYDFNTDTETWQELDS